MRNQRVSVTLLEKAPSDLNLRPVTGADLVHNKLRTSCTNKLWTVPPDDVGV